MHSRTLERGELLIILLEKQVKTMTAHSKLEDMVFPALSGSFLEHVNLSEDMYPESQVRSMKEKAEEKNGENERKKKSVEKSDNSQQGKNERSTREDADSRKHKDPVYLAVDIRRLSA